MINDIKNKIKNFFTKDKIERALITFIECFCSYIALNIQNIDLADGGAIKALIIGAIGSGLSLVINSFRKEKDEEFINPVCDTKEVYEESDKEVK